MSSFRKAAVIAFTLTGLGVAESLWCFPHSHAYFNILAGGPDNGPQHLLDSNIDWGQDVLLLDDWAKRNPDRQLDGIAYAIADWTGIRELTSLPKKSVPKAIHNEKPLSTALSTSDRNEGPKPGRYAMSVRAIYEQNWGYTYFQRLKPIEQVGYTIRIYEVSEDEANLIRQQYGLPTLADTATKQSAN